MLEPIDYTKLEFDRVSDDADLTMINPDDKDEVDTLGVRSFLTTKANVYRKNNLTSVWKVSYDGQIIAFFTVSMNSVNVSVIPTTTQISEMTGRYPSMLLGQMWVIESFRGRQVAYWICQYVIGSAKRITPSIACSCVVLQTDDDERKIRPYKKAGFIKSKSSNDKIWMYKSTR